MIILVFDNGHFCSLFVAFLKIHLNKTDLPFLRISILNHMKVLDVGILDGEAKQKMENLVQT